MPFLVNIDQFSVLVFFFILQAKHIITNSDERPLNFPTSPIEIPLMWTPDKSDKLASGNQSKMDLSHLEEESTDHSGCKNFENGDSFKTKVSHNCSRTRTEMLAFENHDPKCKPYIPECDPNLPEKYMEVQCYQASDFCFCVHTNTGKPFLPGIYERYPNKPKCSKKTELIRKETCGIKKKNSFKRYLRNQFKKDHESLFKNETTPTNTILRWKYTMIDEDKNTLVEPHEWSSFGKETLKFLRKNSITYIECAKRLINLDCDKDKNEIVTINEFKECFKVESRKNRKKKNKSTSISSPSSSSLSSSSSPTLLK